MAEQAQQEPTMEEILSSIRKIIADDDEQNPASEAAVSDNVVEVGDANDDAFDDLEFATDEITQTIPETEDEVLEAISQVETDNDVFDPISSFDDLANEPSLDPIEDSFEAVDEGFEAFEEVELAAEPEPNNAVADSFDEIEAAFASDSELEFETIEEPPIMPTAPLAATQTADAAAGSLGKLLSKVEFGEEAGGNNTIEGVVREMLRPMLKEWLDDNLPAIVEKQVEAEVQRIARMAR